MRHSRFIFLVLCSLVLISACSLPINGVSPITTPIAGIGGLIPSKEIPLATKTNQAAEKNNCTNNYYPVATGVSWKYTGINSTGTPFSYIRTITNVTDEGFADKDVWDSGTTRTGTWTCNDSDLTALNQGGTATVSVPTGTDTPKLEAESVKADGISIPGDMKINESWNQSIKLTGKMTLLQGEMVVDVTHETQTTCTPKSIEKVIVPAGNFDAIKVVCSSSMTVTMDNNAPGNIKGTTTVWYVAGVGIAKILAESEMGSATIELAEYNIPTHQP